jgi:hypothetical protein
MPVPPFLPPPNIKSLKSDLAKEIVGALAVPAVPPLEAPPPDAPMPVEKGVVYD